MWFLAWCHHYTHWAQAFEYAVSVEKKSTNTLKLFVGPKPTMETRKRSQHHKGESVEGHNVVEDNTENHSRQKRSVYTAPQNPGLN